MSEETMIVFDLSEGEKAELRDLDRRGSNPDDMARSIVRDFLLRERIKRQRKAWAKRSANQRGVRA